jgi:DNA mismatch endonuclease (patch repair protein)
VIFVHGCFWHQHAGCRLARMPKARPEYWIPKLRRNGERDTRAQEALKNRGWDVLVIWECEAVHPKDLIARISKYLVAPARSVAIRDS